MLRSLLPYLKTGTFLCIWAASIVAGPGLFAQKSNDALAIGETSFFIQQLVQTEINGRSTLQIQTTDSNLSLLVNVRTTNGIRGEIAGVPVSNAFFDFSSGAVDGKILLPNEKKAYHYYSDTKGIVYVEALDINKIVCVNMYNTPMEPAAENNGSTISSAIPQLQSLPGEIAVVYLDFDGQVVSGGKWNGGNTINAQPAGLTESQMTNAWYVISEDYRPYRLNITTIESVYNAAPKNRRMRCVITPTTTAAPGSGGVAYIGSFDAGDPDNTPCWVFNLGGNGQTTGETCSHEVGHTMGLSHDGKTGGTEYYTGHNNWAPIMGASYNKTVTQWSKGEYTGANQQQDDVTIIATQNGFTWRNDEAGNTTAAASPLRINTNDGTVPASENYGVILKASDIDVYSFRTGAGNVTFTVKPADYFPDLDVLLTITDASGTALATSNPAATLSATISATLPGGVFYLQIDGTGTGNPATGYSDYASVGEYTIEGKVITVPTGIHEGLKTLANVYPNPAVDKISIQLMNPGLHTIQIVNLLGQTLHTLQTRDSLVNVDLTIYDKGIYFVTVAGAENTRTTRFIRE